MGGMNANAKTLQIFRPGRHAAMSGAVLEFSDSDLQATAAAYDPAKHEAPLVVGHPRIDAPAYGWVKGLAFANRGLEAEPDQVEPAFAELVSAGRFKKISASFFAPDAPNNPVPGVYYLRHVGFLGAQPPAVKGLRNPSFAEFEEGVVEFSEWDGVTNASLWRSLRDWLIGKFGQEEADSVLPTYQVQNLEQGAQEAVAKAAVEPLATPAYSESPTHQETVVTPEEKAALEAENAQLKAQLADHAAAARAARIKGLHAEHTAFAEALVAEGKLLPAQVEVCVAALDHFNGQETPVEFGEGDAKQPIAQAFKTFLQALPKQVEFGEVAKAGETVDFADANAIAAAAAKYQAEQAAAGRQITTTQAVAHVTQGA